MPSYREMTTADAKALLAQGYSLDGVWVKHVAVEPGLAELELRNASGLIARRAARANPATTLPRALAFTFQAVAAIAIAHTQNVPLGGQAPGRRFWWRVTSPRERRFYMGVRRCCQAPSAAPDQLHEPEGSRCDVPPAWDLWDASTRGGL